MPINDFEPFCPTSTGTNLTTLPDYIVSTDRVSGQKPGIASSKLNNRALRQANAITSQIAQIGNDRYALDMLDDGNLATLLANLKIIIPAAYVPPTVYRAKAYLSGNISQVAGATLVYDTIGTYGFNPQSIYSTATGITTIPVGGAGLYFFEATTQIVSGSNQGILVNINTVDQDFLQTLDGSSEIRSGSTLLELADGDVLHVTSTGATGTLQGGTNSTYFSMYRISP